jgi:PKD repeat protein
VNTVPAVSFTVAGIANGQVTFSNGSTNAASYLWNFGDGIISTEENPVHTYAVSGTYTVTLTALNDCGVAVFSNEVSVMVVGVEEADWVEQYRLYPNPNSGVFTLELTGSRRDQLIRNDILTLTTGSVVQTFDFGTLPAGLYSFRVSDGISSMVFKVTVK